MPIYIPRLFDAICDIYPDYFIHGLLKIIHDEVIKPDYIKKKSKIDANANRAESEKTTLSFKEVLGAPSDTSIMCNLDIAIEEWDASASSPDTISYYENGYMVEDGGRYMILTRDDESKVTSLELYVNMPGSEDIELIGLYEPGKNKRFIIIDDILSGFDYYYRLCSVYKDGRSESSRFWRLQNPMKGC